MADDEPDVALYYKIPRDGRWLGDGESPDRIGGRDTDIGQLGTSLRRRVRDLYPINEVPGHIHEAADALVTRLSEAERAIGHLIGLVSADQLSRLATEESERP